MTWLGLTGTRRKRDTHRKFSKTNYLSIFLFLFLFSRFHVTFGLNQMVCMCHLLFLFMCYWCLINRGYYMPGHGYEFYLRVVNSISHEWAQRTSEISSWTREHKIHVHKQVCLLYKHQQNAKSVCFQMRDLLCNHNDGDLFTCEDNMLFSRVKIWSFCGEAHLVFI